MVPNILRNYSIWHAVNFEKIWNALQILNWLNDNPFPAFQFTIKSEWIFAVFLVKDTTNFHNIVYYLS